MPFPFTFSLSIPSSSNPFLANAQTETPAKSETQMPSRTVRHDRPGPRRRPSPVPSIPPVPLSRKRGWEPTISQPSLAATSVTSGSGYLDTPAKYREMSSDYGHDHTSQSRERLDREIEDMAAELPPTKRRRTLAGSIASTALSAALIGTAVGLTVYRLLSRWRDRGKESESLPPPPAYEQGEWVPPHQQFQTVVSPPTPRPRKIRNTPAGKRATTRHRRTRTQPNALPSSSSGSATRPEFDFSLVKQPEDEPEDEMDWIGDKLSQLIQEGQKALGREVVVASETQEDEVDDGSGAWQEEYPDSGPIRSSSRSGSMRRSHRPRNIAPTTPSHDRAHSRSGSVSASLNSSPKANRFDQFSQYSGSTMPIPGSLQRGLSVESNVSASTSFREDESQWQSPELRESMSKARARYLANRR